ncbi:MAG: hypothetical protein LBH84_02935 [Prevotellaceae bacterium]|jgi:hypothetical protein|nr:hypothetical protein [Prevotellaceae bacterium]
MATSKKSKEHEMFSDTRLLLRGKQAAPSAAHPRARAGGAVQHGEQKDEPRKFQKNIAIFARPAGLRWKSK